MNKIFSIPLIHTLQSNVIAHRGKKVCKSIEVSHTVSKASNFTAWSDKGQRYLTWIIPAGTKFKISPDTFEDGKYVMSFPKELSLVENGNFNVLSQFTVQESTLRELGYKGELPSWIDS